MKKNQYGFGVTIVLLLLVIIGVIGVAGWYVWNAKNSTSAASSTQTANEQSQISNASPTTSPEDFVNAALNAFNTESEATFETYSTPSFTIFRKSSFTDPYLGCRGKVDVNSATNMYCTGQFGKGAVFASPIPTVSDYTFKDGTKGKSVTFYEKVNPHDAVYVSFKIIPHGDTWLINDYGESSVNAGAPEPKSIPGEAGA